ncbi:MAG: radical SAM protein [Spirochaetes bacterium]|nr:radical SAM protein [Spirochaetota bacterium]
MKILIANIPTQISISDINEKYFIKSGSRWPFSVIKKREEKSCYIPFPFYLAYTSSLLKKEGFDVFVLDGVGANFSESQYFNKFKKIMPDIILIESQTPTISYDLKMLKKMKKINPSLKILLAGPHPTTFYNQLLKDNSFINIILLREYEIPCLEVIKSNFNIKKLKKIKGIAFRDNKKIIMNDAELLNIEKLPFPDRFSFPLSDKPNLSVYWDGFCQLKPCIQMHASRGCPFRCNFCLWNQVMYCNKQYRPFNVKKIVDEMEFCVKKFNAKEIYFDDDTFTGNKNHVIDFCKEVIRRKLKIKWSCMGDAMITDKEMINFMHKAGCIGIKFGVESSSKKILNEIGKPLDFNKVKIFLQECSKRKIKTHATFTFGIMGETKETMQKTLDYAKNIDVDSVQFSITIPFPGTRYFDKMDQEGKILSKNWEDYDGSNKSIVDFGTLSNKEIEDFCSHAKQNWLKHKKNDFKWLRRQIFFQIRSSFNQGAGYFINKLKKFINLI